MKFPFGHKDGLSADTQVMITENGRRYAMDIQSQNAPNRILDELYERSPNTVRDIAKGADVNMDETKSWLQKMEKQGLVQLNVNR